jgi:hypothetical protein
MGGGVVGVGFSSVSNELPSLTEYNHLQPTQVARPPSILTQWAKRDLEGERGLESLGRQAYLPEGGAE